MKKWLSLFSALLILITTSYPQRNRSKQNTDPLRIRSRPHTESTIIDHNCTDIESIPSYWIEKVKSEFRIAYGHTSHGSQIISGMEVLAERSELYAFNHDGDDGALSIHDRTPAGDLGNPSKTEWYYRTKALLDDPNNDRTMIIWAWCGQANTSPENMDLYLDLMNSLEGEYPHITFVYMTGHLNGTGEEGNLHQRNNQIRDFCRANNKILYDFADIESYDPDGNYFLDKYADDGCNYDSNADGYLDANWADEWCAAHPGECSSCQCAHSRSLNCDLKAKAFWWMMAVLSGWDLATCDFNKDGIANINDYFDIRDATYRELDEWINECYTPKNDCADFNQDGTIDANDLTEKRESMIGILNAWMEHCGFKKKGVVKR